jgi:sec-independent protein translocase protein TatC
VAVAGDGLSADARADLGLTKRSNPDARMPLLDHLRELRNRVVKIAIAVTAGSVVGWFVYTPVWNFISAPYCKLPQPKGFGTLVLHQSCQLYVNGLFDSLFLKLQISIATGVILTLPIWLYQVWAFIAPGLYKRERRWAYYFVGAAVPLFAIGATMAYFAMTKGLHFLLGLVPAHTTALITINTYLGYAGAMLLIFGLAFELPLIFVLLNVAGVLTHARFRKWRRMIIFLVFAFAAIFTPSPDPISMLLLAVPCVVLVEASEVFVWANDRRRVKRGNSLGYVGLTEAEVAAYGLDDPIDEAADAGSGPSAN